MTPEQFRQIIREELQPLEERCAAIHDDLKALRSELVGVIDPKFRVMPR